MWNNSNFFTWYIHTANIQDKRNFELLSYQSLEEQKRFFNCKCWNWSQLQISIQSWKQGLGFGAYKSIQLLHKGVTLSLQKLVLTSSEESWLQHSVWAMTNFAEPFDIPWNNLIWGSMSPYVITFVACSKFNYHK